MTKSKRVPNWFVAEAIDTIRRTVEVRCLAASDVAAIIEPGIVGRCTPQQAARRYSPLIRELVECGVLKPEPNPPMGWLYSVVRE